MVAACFVIVTLAACDLLGPSGPSGPGLLYADLESPNGQEGAAVLELAGGRGLSTVSLDGGDVFYEQDGSTIRSSLAGYRVSFTKVPDGSEGGEP